MEIWMDITGYNGMYQVSNTEKVRSLPRPYKRVSVGPTSESGLLIVKKMRNEGCSLREIGERFGVTPEAIYQAMKWETKKRKGVRGRHLKQSRDSDGYLVVGLVGRDGKLMVKKVHRLVAEAFIPNPLKRPEVHHKDENKRNNRPENLEWVTSKEHGQKHKSQHIGANNGNAKLCESEVIDIIEKLRLGHPPIMLANDYGMTVEAIRAIKGGHSWKHLPR